MVVAQLIERSLPIPDIPSSNPLIGKILYWTFTVNCIEKMRLKKKRPRMAHFYLKKFAVRCRQLEIRSLPDTTYIPSYRCYAFVAIVNKCFPQLWTDNEFLSLLFEGHVCGLLSLTMWFKCVRARVQTSLTGMTAYFTYLQRDKVHNQTTAIWAMVVMVVSVLILYSDDPSSNPAEVYSLNFVKLFEKYKN